jgi:sRNA-binding protein
VQQAQARNKHYKLTDQGGLYLYISPKGGRSWRYDYYLCEKRETVTFGQYPDFSLAEARELHAKARQLVARGESPARAKQAEKRAAKEAARAAREAMALERKSDTKAIPAFNAGKRINEATLGDLVAFVTHLRDVWSGERSTVAREPGEEEGK